MPRNDNNKHGYGQIKQRLYALRLPIPQENPVETQALRLPPRKKPFSLANTIFIPIFAPIINPSESNSRAIGRGQPQG